MHQFFLLSQGEARAIGCWGDPFDDICCYLYDPIDFVCKARSSNRNQGKYTEMIVLFFSISIRL
jgi:hypothetical protein